MLVIMTYWFTITFALTFSRISTTQGHISQNLHAGCSYYTILHKVFPILKSWINEKNPFVSK